MSEGTIDHWSSDMETVLTDILENCKRQQMIHKVNYLKLRHYLFLVRLPVIVISAINSVLSVGLNSYVNQTITSTTNCILSLFCGILGSIELFMGISTQSEKEFASYQACKLLAIKISSTLKLNREHRVGDGLVFLTEAISEYNTIFESSLIHVAEIKDDLLNPLRAEI